VSVGVNAIKERGPLLGGVREGRGIKGTRGSYHAFKTETRGSNDPFLKLRRKGYLLPKSLRKREEVWLSSPASKMVREKK